MPALVVLRGAAMPRLFDSACHDQIFIAASASRDRFAPFGEGEQPLEVGLREGEEDAAERTGGAEREQGEAGGGVVRE